MSHIAATDKLFTPRMRTTDERMRFYISASDREALGNRGLGYKGIVTDVATGTRYRVFGATCGLSGCDCDATVVPVESEVAR